MHNTQYSISINTISLAHLRLLKRNITAVDLPTCPADIVDQYSKFTGSVFSSPQHVVSDKYL